MSKAMDKIYRELYKFIGERNPQNEQEFNQLAAEFQEKYNASLSTPDSSGTFLPPDELDKAYALLDQAEMASSIAEARKLAKQAYKTSPECFDAVIFLAENAPNPVERYKIISEGLAREEARLKHEKIYTKENTGDFYLIYETRPYMRGLMSKAMMLVRDRKMRQALAVCQEMLRLNRDDSQGARYLLMALYAYFEDEKSALALLKQYPYEEFLMVYSMFILYYKIGNDEQAKKYFQKTITANEHILEHLAGKTPAQFYVAPDFYARGSKEEIAVYNDSYGFLAFPVYPGLQAYARSFLKAQKQPSRSKSQKTTPDAKVIG